MTNDRTVASNKKCCFAAGTLVHTKKGLVPIEQIKIGDLVLSKRENGQGLQEYKLVIRTIESENVPVDFMRYLSKSGVEQLVVNADHPFFVKGAGWVRAGNVSHPDKLESFDGTPLSAWECCTLWNTDIKGVSAAFGSQTDCGTKIDFRSGQAVITSEQVEPLLSDSLTCKTVYNIEVEDFHTYYIGELGVWVHDTDCSS